MKKRENAYLTVYLTLSLTVLLTLCLLLIEGVRRNGAVLEATCAADVGMQSIMAEYHRELMKQYNLFAIDVSYGTSSCVKRNTESHLYQYLEKNLRFGERDFFALYPNGAELTGVSILTDGNGQVFRQRAVEAIRDDMGLGALEQLREWMRIVEINALEETKPRQEKELLDKEIEEYEFIEEDGTVKKLENPTGQLNEMRGKGILKLVLPEGTPLSEKAVSANALIGSRMKQEKVNHGNMENDSSDETIAERFLFQEYLIRYMGCYTNEKSEGALGYQLEYLIMGEDYDVDNLRGVAGRLCALREAANAVYLFSDMEKRGEAEVLAATICSALLVPELTPVLQASILLGWAYAESLYDVEMLLSGKKISLLKDKNSWHLGLSAALDGDFSGSGEEEEGLTYEDYLRIFMMLTDTDTLTMRAMDMVEADIRNTPGNKYFRMDGCYDKIQAKINIASRYDYAFELIREKTYE